jgi:hypothetical protein
VPQAACEAETRRGVVGLPPAAALPTWGASWSEAEAEHLQERPVTADEELLRILRTSLPQGPLLTRLVRAANGLDLPDEVGGDAVAMTQSLRDLLLVLLLAGAADPVCWSC